MSSRSPSIALSHQLVWLGGFFFKNRLQKKVGTLILTSLEDLVFHGEAPGFH